MNTEKITQNISKHLRYLMLSKNLKLQYVASKSNVGVETVRRAKYGKIKRLLDPTAVKLATFIEQETNGGIRADYLLENFHPTLRSKDNTLQKPNPNITDSWQIHNLQGIDLTHPRLLKFWRFAMFTGIVQEKCKVIDLTSKKDFLSYAVEFDQPLLEDLQQGASVAIDGVCQTVRHIDNNKIWFDAMAETLDKTTLTHLQKGDLVNVERSTKIGQENGGHEVSGHVDGVLEIVAIHQSENNLAFTFKVPEAYLKYIFNKGFLSIQGASLTVSNLNKSERTFQVFLIPETLRLTNLGTKKVGDQLNFEIDRRTQAIVDTVITYLSENQVRTTS